MVRTYRLTNAIEPHYNRSEDGCSASPTCLTCPLPKCRYELAQGQQRVALTQQRDSMIRKVRKKGASIATIAAAASLSERTIHRILFRGKGTP